MTLSSDELSRYSRHLIMPDVGLEGQEKLKAAHVLCIGTGGLGSPIGLYLAAAGVGHLGLVDFDVIDTTNLQRQVAFTTADINKSKVETTQQRLQALNPFIEITAHNTRLTSENALDILGKYDVVVDGTDNFATRYLVNDACVLLGKPLVHGSIHQFDGQLSVFDARRGPCYRCLYAAPPPPNMAPSCAEAGVLGVLPAVIGSLQATEAIKLVIGKGDPLIGRLMLFNALKMSFRTLNLRKKPACPICGTHPTINQLIDYEEFCGSPGAKQNNLTVQEDEVSAEQLKAILEAQTPVTLIDVREPYENEICRLNPSTLIPMKSLLDNVEQLDVAKQYILYCRTGARSRQALDLLKSSGFKRVKHLKGGILEWADKVDPSLPRY